MTAADLLNRLAADVPEAQPAVVQHLEDHESLLLHLLIADLRRFAIQCFEAGQSEVIQRLLDLIDLALREGTEEVENAMSVSFVEDTGWWDSATQPFIEAWPPGLRAELDRPRNHRAWTPAYQARADVAQERRAEIAKSPDVGQCAVDATAIQPECRTRSALGQNPEVVREAAPSGDASTPVRRTGTARTSTRRPAQAGAGAVGR